MSSVLGMSHLVAPSASAAVAATVVTAAATSNGQPDTPPPPETTTTTASTSLMREENGRSSFDHEEPKNQGENGWMHGTRRHVSHHVIVYGLATAKLWWVRCCAWCYVTNGTWWSIFLEQELRESRVGPPLAARAYHAIPAPEIFTSLYSTLKLASNRQRIYNFVANLDTLRFKNLYALDKLPPGRTGERADGGLSVCENLMYHISAEKELQEGETFPPLKTDFTGQN